MPSTISKSMLGSSTKTVLPCVMSYSCFLKPATYFTNTLPYDLVLMASYHSDIRYNSHPPKLRNTPSSPSFHHRGAIQPQGHWPIIDQRYMHMRLENTL